MMFSRLCILQRRIMCIYESYECVIHSFHLKPNFYYNNSNPIDEYGQYPLEQKVMEMSDKKEDNEEDKQSDDENSEV